MKDYPYPKLYIGVGLPGSGKSTYFKNRIDWGNTVYVSRDTIRFSLLEPDDAYFSKEKEVYAKFIELLVWGLRHGQDVIADATHLNRRARKKLVDAIKEKFGEPFAINIVFFDVPLETCLERNSYRTGREYVSEDIIKNMYYDHFEKPRKEEFSNCFELITIKNC